MSQDSFVRGLFAQSTIERALSHLLEEDANSRASALRFVIDELPTILSNNSLDSSDDTESQTALWRAQLLTISRYCDQAPFEDVRDALRQFIASALHEIITQVLPHFPLNFSFLCWLVSIFAFLASRALSFNIFFVI
jgi:hypothetical protein